MNKTDEHRLRRDIELLPRLQNAVDGKNIVLIPFHAADGHENLCGGNVAKRLELPIVSRCGHPGAIANALSAIREQCVSNLVSDRVSQTPRRSRWIVLDEKTALASWNGPGFWYICSRRNIDSSDLRQLEWIIGRPGPPSVNRVQNHVPRGLLYDLNRIASPGEPLYRFV
jgi:hypothetical protein